MVTSGPLRVRDFLAQAEQRRAENLAEERELKETRARTLASRAELSGRAATALDELTAALLPALDEAAVQRAVTLTGYSPLAQKRLIAARDEERERLRTRLAAIEQDPRVVNREALLGPVVGSVTLAIREAQEGREPLVALCAKAAHPRLQRLLELGYGTGAYRVGFWKVDRYRDWKAGREIARRFPDRKKFAELRVPLEQAFAAVVVYDERLAALQAEVKACDDLIEERRGGNDLLATIEPRHLTAARKLLGDYVSDLATGQAFASLGARLAGEPDLELLAKRYAGLRAQLKYLEELQGSLLDPLSVDLVKEREKLSRDLTKYKKPKHASDRFRAEELQRRFERPRLRTRKALDRYQKIETHVVTFHHYERSSLVEEFLWWDLITHGRVDGSRLPSVAAFHQAYPDYQYAPPDPQAFQQGAAAAAAEAAAERDLDAAADPDLAEDAS